MHIMLLTSVLIIFIALQWFLIPCLARNPILLQPWNISRCELYTSVLNLDWKSSIRVSSFVLVKSGQEKY